MATDDRDDEKWRMGRLIEDKLEKDPLFGKSRRSVSFTRLVLHDGIWKRTFHAKVKNKKRGRAKASRSTTRFKLSDYILREGRHEVRNEDLLAKGGHDPVRVCELIARAKEEARNWNFSIALQFTIELPAELPLARHIEFANTVADGLEKSGRPPCWAIHPPNRNKKGRRKRSDKNTHLHVLAPARPIIEADGELRVGKGKYFPDRAAVACWRVGLANAANAQMEAEGLSHEKCARWFPGTLAQLGNARPTKLPLSARAARRDEPDLSHPHDDYAVIWNEKLEAGMDPRKDSFIRERQEDLARDRIRKKLERGTKELEKKAAGSGAASPNQDARTYKEKLAGKVLDLPPISDDELADIELAHWYLGIELSTEWQWTEAGRSKARSIRDSFANHRKETNFRYAPPSHSAGHEFIGRIYLDMRDDEAPLAFGMGGCLDRVSWAVFVPTDAPKAVLARLFGQFRRHDEVYPGRAYINVPQGGYEEAFDLGAVFDRRTQAMYAPEGMEPLARETLLSRFPPFPPQERPPRHFSLVQTVPKNRLQQLSSSYVAAVTQAHQALDLPLTPGWANSAEDRAAAEGVRLAVQKQAEAKREQEEEQKRIDAETARRNQAAEDQAHAVAKRQAEVAEQQRRLQEAEAARQREFDAATQRIAAEVNRCRGVLRITTDGVAGRYPGARGEVCTERYGVPFLRAQTTATLQHMYWATLEARKGARPQTDEFDVVDWGLSFIRNEAERRKVKLLETPPAPPPRGGTPPTGPASERRTQQPPKKKDRGQGR